MSERFEQMTVAELRKTAKEMNVRLGSGITKQGIVEKLTAAAAAMGESVQTAMAGAAEYSVENGPAAAEENTPVAPPVRRAAIITDDGTEDDDLSMLPPRGAVAPRPVIPPRSTGMGGTSSLNSISSKAPAFTMEGSRAWHNPRTYTATGYQRPMQPAWNNRPVGDVRTYSVRSAVPGRMAPQAPGRVMPSYPRRFGPEQLEPNMPQDYRVPYGAPVQQDYRDYQQPVPRSGYMRRDVMEGQQPTMNELLMAGECGDATGVLELQPEGYGFLKADVPGGRDVYVSAAQIRRFSLRSGDRVTGKTRPQRETDRSVALLYITEVNGQNPEDAAKRVPFEGLTALYPHRRVRLTARGHQDPFLRLSELLFPVGFGQRALVRVPAGCDPAPLFMKLANTAALLNPKAQVVALVLDEKPEDVTELRERMQAEVVAHTSDQPIEALVRTAENALERAQRLVEQKADVILLVNDISRLCRACAQLVPAAARTMANGLAAGCMNKPRRFFGSARNTREAGSLTVLAFQRLKPNDPAADAAAEELRQMANLQITLMPQAGKKIEPAVDLTVSRNSRPELLLTETEARAAQLFRAGMMGMAPDAALDFAAEFIEKTENNEALLASLNSAE